MRIRFKHICEDSYLDSVVETDFFVFVSSFSATLQRASVAFAYLLEPFSAYPQCNHGSAECFRWHPAVHCGTCIFELRLPISEK